MLYSLLIDCDVPSRLLSIGGISPHYSGSTVTTRRMANSSVNVSFECMRVDISRPWLCGKLFCDDGLKVMKENWYVPGTWYIRTIDADFRYLFSISTGPNVLAKPVDQERNSVVNDGEKLTSKELLRGHGMFPIYHTCTPSVLADVVYPLISALPSSVHPRGERRTQDHRRNLRYPTPLLNVFQIRWCASHVPRTANFRSEVRTLTGAFRPPPLARWLRVDASEWKPEAVPRFHAYPEITTKSPQIIGWIFQIVLALPRVTSAQP